MTEQAGQGSEAGLGQREGERRRQRLRLGGGRIPGRDMNKPSLLSPEEA